MFRHQVISSYSTDSRLEWESISWQTDADAFCLGTDTYRHDEQRRWILLDVINRGSWKIRACHRFCILLQFCLSNIIIWCIYEQFMTDFNRVYHLVGFSTSGFRNFGKKNGDIFFWLFFYRINGKASTHCPPPPPPSSWIRYCLSVDIVTGIIPRV